MSFTVAFFDVDGTLTTAHTWQAYFAAFAHFQRHGAIRRLFFLTHYPLYFARRRGLLSEERFRTWWAGHLAWMLRGLTPEETAPLWQWAVHTYLADHWRADMLRRLHDHHRKGDKVVLVSSAPVPLLEAIGEFLAAHAVVGTRPALRNGRYTGGIVPPVCIGPTKRTLTKAKLAALGWEVDFAASAAYADSITDVPLLEMVGHPYAVYPDPPLKALAQKRGWMVLA